MALNNQNISVQVGGTLTKTVGARTLELSLGAQLAVAYTSGTGAGQADLIYNGSRTLSASATEDIDLAGTFLQDIYGNNLTFVKIRAILIVAATGNTNSVVVGNASATQFVGPFGGATHTIAVPPGGAFLITRGASDSAGWTVGAGSTDLLKVANSAGGTSVTYEIVIIGTSA